MKGTKYSSRRMVSVHLCFNRENMATLESMLAMYETSEDQAIQRIACRAREHVTEALEEYESQAKMPYV